MSHRVMSHRMASGALLAALLALGGCALSDSAPSGEAPAVEAVTVAAEEEPMAQARVAPGSPAGPAEDSAGDDFGDPASADDLLQALDGRPEPPPPPPSRARRTQAVVDADTVDEPAPLGGEGLGLRGSGAGGGGQGFGRIHGMGRIDTGGGKGVGRGTPGRRVAKKSAAPEPEIAALRETAEEIVVDDGEVERDVGAQFALGGMPKRPLRPKDEAVAKEKKPTQPAEPLEDRRARDDKAFDRMLEPLDGTIADQKGRPIEPAEYPLRFDEPARTLPRMCYFENTYLGGNAAYTERLRRLDDALPGGRQPYRAAALPGQPFDPPEDDGLALTATLDRAYVDRPQRVFLQVGLQGSKRYGWRRPPLDIALVVDQPAQGDETLIDAITALSRRLGPQDRLAVVLAGRQPVMPAPVAPLRDRLVLARAIEALEPPAPGDHLALAGAMTMAGDALQKAAGDTARIPGTQTVLVLTRGGDRDRVMAATRAAHALTVQGAVTSVIQLGGAPGDWWQVANAGHGNYHRAPDDGLAAAVDDELGSIARVIARLLRINIRLAPQVEAIRVVGSRVLGREEVKQVKAREEATDRNLSKTMGVKADRGEDDDGIQTVIPYFYGGDSHVILVELWVKGPGPVADVTLKYKDMVALQNATARVSAHVDRVPRPLTPAERRVAANVRGFRLAEGLGVLADRAEHASAGSVLDALDDLEALAIGRDRALLEGFETLVRQRGADGTVAEALRMARDRRIGHSPR